jgi:TatD DNase family protein
VIDFHCHLDLYPNPHAVRDECLRREMYVLSVTTTPSAWHGTTALAAKSDNIRTALGLHPQLAHERRSELTLFDAFISDTRYIGEIGLDGAPEFRKYWRDQVAVFEHILSKCREAGGRIMSIHSRRASGAVLDHLENNRAAGTAVLHWFSGSLHDLDRAASLGCWFSVGPAMLLSENGRSLAARMPRDRVLTESDGPFAQIDGAAVKPWEVRRAVDEIGAIWSQPQDEVEQKIDRNLKNLLEQYDQ